MAILSSTECFGHHLLSGPDCLDVPSPAGRTAQRAVEAESHRLRRVGWDLPPLSLLPGAC